jgi:hypothetical protein
MLTRLFGWLQPRKLSTRTKPKATLQLEQLEERLTPSWAGTAPALIKPPTVFTQVNLDFQSDAGGVAAISNNEVDWYRFTARATHSYTFQVLHQGGSLDPVIGVFNAAGSRLATNNDVNSTDHDSRLSVNLVAGQMYYLGVTSNTGSPGGNYGWSLIGGDDRYETNNSFTQSANVGLISPQRQIDHLVMDDGVDWFRFSIARAGQGGFAAINYNPALGDLGLALVNGSGAQIRASDSHTGVERIALDGLAAGTYYLHVWGDLGETNPFYSLNITAPAPAAPVVSAQSRFQITLHVTGLTTTEQGIFEQAAARWESIILSSPSGGVSIDVSGQPIDGVGGVLGDAGPDTIYSGSGLPSHGVLRFDTADLDALVQSGQLESVALHEMAHVLGFGTIWDTKGLLSGAGTADPRFIGKQATAEYNAIFGLHESGVPVENTGGVGTADSHWRKSVFGNELMTGYLSSTSPLSKITIASLADLGYTVNLNAADPYSPPGGA